VKGFVQVYTGDGKGKTTAALGLTLRAYGAGLHVFIAQFLKGRETSEIKAVKKLGDLIKVKQYGKKSFIFKEPDEGDKLLAKNAIKEIETIIKSGIYDIVILDEANVAVHIDLITVEDLLEIIEEKPKNMELIITGRYAPNKIIEVADLVTEMKMVKHYYNKGINARVGIEK